MAEDTKAKFDINEWLQKLQEFDVNDINDIDWENMGLWPLAGRVFFAVLLFVAILVGGYFLLVKDQQSRLDRISQEEVKLKKDFEKNAFRVANLDEYKAQLIEMEDSFGSLLKQLPRDTEVPGLIDDISAAALGSGLVLNKIDPEGLKQTEFYNELPINVEVIGGYHEMGSFVSSVAALPRIVTLHDFSIESGERSNTLTMKIQAKTYQYLDEEAE